MYKKSAKFYDTIHHFLDYNASSKKLNTLIKKHNPNAKTLLDVGCGTAKHLQYLRKYYYVEGLDLCSDLLKFARERCPEVSFHQRNMTDFNLGRTFDVITCLFASISYVKTVECLDQAVASMARHLRPGGIMIVEPWVNPESYWRDKVVANFVDEPDLKITWMYTHEIDGLVSVFNSHYLVGTPQGIEYFTEKYEMGLFTQEQYLDSFRKAGLEVYYDDKGVLVERGMYIGVSPENCSYNKHLKKLVFT